MTKSLLMKITVILLTSLFAISTSTYGMKKIVLQQKANSNILTQSMMSEPNAIYVIESDFNLAGSKITVPINCVLQFDGGSLSKGTLVGQKTNITAAPITIFAPNLILQGTWNATDYLCEWFDGDVEKCINTFANISFIQETVISKPVHIRKWTTISLKAAHSIKVSDDFVGDYLFEAQLDVEDPATSRYYFNPNLEFTGNGLIDLNNKTCLIRALKVKGKTVGGTLMFNNVMCIKAAKSLNKKEKVAMVWTECITNCISSQFTVERFRKGAQDPDYGFNLLCSDNRFMQTYVCLSTIGFYNCGGTSFFDQVHVWGGPEICFYIKGNCAFSNCYSDWGKVAYFVDGYDHVSISNHSFLGPSTKDERFKNLIYYVIKTKKKAPTLKGLVTFSSISNSRINLLGYGDVNEKTTPYITSWLRWGTIPYNWYNKIDDNTPANIFLLQQANLFRVEIKPGQLCLLLSPFGPYNRGVHCRLFALGYGAEDFKDMLLTDKFIRINDIKPNLSFYYIDNKLYAKNNGSKSAWFYFDTSQMYEMSNLIIADQIWDKGSYPSNLSLTTPLPVNP